MSEPTDIDDGGPAFPDPVGFLDGMSKREVYAGQIMASLLGAPGGWIMSSAAEISVKAADALIAELKK